MEVGNVDGSGEERKKGIGSRGEEGIFMCGKGAMVNPEDSSETQIDSSIETSFNV